ncbi:MAG: Xaa-Pro peptidase family protein [Candidatus Omnitrophica bacterium]|nr:Xaa-Pro peptidase family protein [Candidatus Omnitrophota bacterium]
MVIEKKVEKIKEHLEKEKLQAIITKNPSHIFYLTGILEIEGYLIIDRDNIYLLITPLYLYECSDFAKNNKMKNFHIIEIKEKTLKKFLSKYKKLGIINKEITYNEYKNLQKEVKTKIFLLDDFIFDLRSVKDEKEIENIQKAKDIAEKVIEKIKNNIKDGITELDLAGEIKYEIIKNGGRRESFEPIVASGIHSSYPHHKSKNRKIKKGDVVIIDLGADYNGYKSDITYTFFIGNVDDEIKKIYRIVEETQKICIDFSNIEKIKGKELYTKAIENFKKYKFEKFFIHGLGHGIGIDVHEKPYLNKNGEELKKGNIFTIEPGIYIHKKFGIRLETMIFKQT